MDQPSEQALREAAHWRTSMMSGVVSPGVRAEFEAWRARPENARAYEDLTLSAAMLAMASKRNPPRMPRRIRIAPMVLGLAAAFLLGIVMLRSTSWTHYDTEIGEQLVAREGDIAVTLNTGTQVALRKYRPEARLVAGEAYFEGDATIVYAHGHTLRSQGGAFSARWSDDQLQVIAAHGSVEWAHGARRQQIRHGFRLVADNNTHTIGPATSRALAWRRGWLDFEGEPLALVIAETRRYGGPVFVIEDDEAARLPVVARFRIESAERLPDIIAAHLTALEVRERDGAFHVRTRALSDL